MGLAAATITPRSIRVADRRRRTRLYGNVMQAILACSQASATIQTSYFAAAAPCTFSGNLGTISVTATPAGVQSLMGNLPSGVKLLTFTGSTAERQSAWATAPSAIGSPPLGLPYYDTSLVEPAFRRYRDGDRLEQPHCGRSLRWAILCHPAWSG